MDAGTHPKLEGSPHCRCTTRFANAPWMPSRSHTATTTTSARCRWRCGCSPGARDDDRVSYFIIERVLHNSVNVMKRQADEKGIAEYPLYTHREVDELAPLFQGYRYNREIEWSAFEKAAKGQSSPTLEFHDAGHALGSAGIMVRGKKETLFYTGDVCLHDQTSSRPRGSATCKPT